MKSFFLIEDNNANLDAKKNIIKLKLSKLDFKITFLIFSRSLLPPGSLVKVDLILFFIKYFFKSFICVDFPEYSKPSKLITFILYDII